MGRYDLTDFEWEAITPHLPTSHVGCRGSMTGGC